MLTPIMTATVAGLVLLFAVFLHLYRTRGDRYLLYWALAWAGWAAIDAVAVVGQVTGPSILFTVASSFFSASSALLLMLGTASLAGRRLGRGWWALVGLAALWTVVSDISGLSEMWRALPISALVAGLLIWAGVSFLRMPASEGAGQTVAGWGLILLGLHQADYPFVQAMEGVAVWGYAAALILTYVIGIGVLLVFFDRVNDELAQSQDRYRKTFEQAAVGIAHVSLDGRLLATNNYMREMLGYAPGELDGATLKTITHPDDIGGGQDRIARVLTGELQRYKVEKRCIGKAGNVVWVNLTVSVIRDSAGNPSYLLSLLEDITAQRATEAQLRQAQRMKAIGQLTGGIAHDFNNLLTVMMGGIELASEEVAVDSIGADGLDVAMGAAKRGASLTHRLLAFSRKQQLRPRAISVDNLLHGMTDLLTRTLGEPIDIGVRADAGLWSCHVDPSQLENVILNLSINARDAMPEGGALGLAARNVQVDEADCEEREGLVPGDYVAIEVTDTGTGMTEEAIRRAFEPFFTTKQLGKGSGLGLSMVYGFAKQSDGHVEIESRPGAGTTVRLLLPRATADQGASGGQPATEADTRGRGEAILVLEDEDAVRTLAISILTRLGYEPLPATDGREALEVLEARPDIVLLFTDVVLPGGMSGPEVAKLALARRPDLKVLYTSGYAEAAVLDKGGVDGSAEILEKPYLKEALAQKVHASLKGESDGISIGAVS